MAKTLKDTLRTRGANLQPNILPPLRLTILAHRDPRRVGEQAVFFGLRPEGGSVEVSRETPSFIVGRRSRARTGPLDDLRISRKTEFRIKTDGRDTWVQPGETESKIYVEGRLLRQPVQISEPSLERGVTILIAHHICLLLHSLDDLDPRWALVDDGMVGESGGLQRARRAIAYAAESEEPVLIRGENGCGKELAAASIHRQSARGRKKLHAANIAGLAESLASAELFGSVRGGFTHATDRKGYFESAAGSSLLLDEIGDSSMDVQQQLLRAVEQRVIRRVGSSDDIKVDVRLIAATDRDLETAIAERRFSAPLFYRLNIHSVDLPPLRRRREDIPRLVYHFVKKELEKLKREDLLAPRPDGDKPWIPGWLLDRLTRYPWPGNVRELRSMVLKLVRPNLNRPQMSLPRDVEEQLQATAFITALDADSTTSAPHSTGAPRHSRDLESRLDSAHELPKKQQTYRDMDAVSDAELERVHAEAKFQISETAKRLGVQRTALDKRIREHPTLRRGKDLALEEILTAEKECDGNPQRAAERLKVSPKALKDRKTRLLRDREA